jgi:hypothetical protein
MRRMPRPMPHGLKLSDLKSEKLKEICAFVKKENLDPLDSKDTILLIGNFPYVTGIAKN